MERIRIKCPVCGNEEFIEIGKPYSEGFETYIDDYTKYRACTKCGLILRFAKDIVDSKLKQEYLATDKGKKWKQLEDQLSNLQNNKKNMESRLNAVDRTLRDDSRSVATDKQLKEERKQLLNKIETNNKEIAETEKEIEKYKLS